MHISAVESAGLRSPNEGAKVSYEEVENRGKHPSGKSRGRLKGDCLKCAEALRRGLCPRISS